jgi:copper(I)-binding protein
MVSRQTARPLRKLVPAVAIGAGALLGIVGCAAGQVAQTAVMEPAVNGNQGQVGDILLRDVMVAFPESGESYRAGDDAPLVLTIVNVGSTDDELTGVSSPAGQVEIIGNAKIPARFALQVVQPGENPSAPSASSASAASSPGAETTSSATSGAESSSPETSGSKTSGSNTSGTNTSGSSAPPRTTTTTEPPAPDVVGTISLIITDLKGDLPYGKTVPVTFEFAHAGKVTVELPVAAPSTARQEGRDDSEAEGH